MSDFKKYFTARSHVYMRPYEPGEEIRWVDKVHVSPRDGATGSPKLGDYIAYNAEKPEEHYLISAENFKSYEATGEGEVTPTTSAEDTQAPMVRDPLKAAEADEQRAQEGEASTKTVITSKPEEGSQEASQTTEEPSKQDEPVKEEPKAETTKKEEPKQEALKPAAKEPPKFPHKAK